MSEADIVTRLDDLCVDSAGRPVSDAGMVEFVDVSLLREAAAKITGLRSLNAELVEALENVAAACRGSGPWARDHDTDCLRTIGKMIEPALARATKESDHG